MNNKEFYDRIALAVNTLAKDNPFMYKLLSEYSDIQPPEEGSGNIVAYTKYVQERRLMSVVINLDHTKEDDGTLLFQSNEQIVFILIHEILHNILGHFTRKQVLEHNKKDKSITNYILDCHINPMIGDMRKVIYNNKHILEGYMATFQEIENIAKERGNGWRYESQKLYQPIELWLQELAWLYENGGEGLSQYGDHPEVDESESDNSAKEVSMADMVQEIKELVTTSGKQFSKGEDAFIRAVECHIGKPRKILNFPGIKAVVASVNESNLSNYTKYNALSGVYGYPKRQRIEKYEPIIMVCMDTSGSVCDDDIVKMYNILARIKGKTVLIPWSSHKIAPESVINNPKIKDYKNIKLASDGGTDISTLWDYISQYHSTKKVVLVCITDMAWHRYPTPSNVSMIHFIDTARDNQERIVEKYKCTYTPYTKLGF